MRSLCIVSNLFSFPFSSFFLLPVLHKFLKEPHEVFYPLLPPWQFVFLWFYNRRLLWITTLKLVFSSFLSASLLRLTGPSRLLHRVFGWMASSRENISWSSSLKLHFFRSFPLTSLQIFHFRLTRFGSKVHSFLLSLFAFFLPVGLVLCVYIFKSFSPLGIARN